MQIRTSGGASDSDAKALIVTPCGPSGAGAVTTVMPVAKRAIASRNCRASTLPVCRIMRLVYALLEPADCDGEYQHPEAHQGQNLPPQVIDPDTLDENPPQHHNEIRQRENPAHDLQPVRQRLSREDEPREQHARQQHE